MTAADPSTAPRQGNGAGLPATLVGTIAAGTVLQALNASTMAVALVDIREHFHGGAATTWLISVLYLATAVGSPTAGRLADLFGARRVFLTALALTAVSSVASCLAPTLGWLIAFRALLGIGTCAAYPAGLALLRADADRRGITLPATALSVLAIGGQVMIAIGPVVGGFLVHLWGWRAIFAMNVPLAAGIGALALAVLPDDRRRPTTTVSKPLWRELDVVGAGVFAAFISVLMLFLLSLAHRPNWWLVAALLALAALLVGWELRAPTPFIDVRVLVRNRALTATYLRTALTYVAFYQVFYGLPAWAQTARGLSPSAAGLVMLPMAVLAAITVFGAGRLLRRTGYWPVLAAGSAVLLAGATGLLHMHSASSLLVVLAVAALLGVPNGLNNIGNQSALYQQAAAADTGIASGLYRTSQYVGANIAAAMIELCFAGPASDPGLHRMAAAVAVISVVLLAGALLGSLRQRRLH